MSKRREIQESIVTENAEHNLFKIILPKNKKDIFVKNSEESKEHTHFYITRSGEIGSVKTDETKEKGNGRNTPYNKTLSQYRKDRLKELNLP